MTWILLATAAQFLNAAVAIIDKYIVTDERVLPRPFIYAFYSCLITGGWVLIYFLSFVPWFAELGVPSFSNVQQPSLEVVAMSFLAAYTFFMALVSMYDSLKRSEASTVIPIIGAVSALSSFLMTYLFFETRLADHVIVGILLLAIGTLLVAQTLPKYTVVLTTLHSGLFFGLHFITMKGLFMETSFDDGFFWTRVSFVFFGLSLLLVPAYWQKISTETKQTSRKAGLLVLGNKVLAGVAAFLLLKATHLGDVAAVQATDGLKFVFILFISILVGSRLPNTCVECETRPKIVTRQILYVAVIVIGYILLFEWL